MRIVFFDVETTGIGKEDRLCQLAFKIQGDEKGIVSLFKPPLPITTEASAITGITNKAVAECEPFKNSLTCNLFKKMMEEPGTIAVAHNAVFDVSFLSREGIIIPHFICTLRVTHHLDKKGELPKHTLQFLRYHHNIEVEADAHDALGDVLVLEKLFELYRHQISLEEMLEVSSHPVQLKKMPFGKYKGLDFRMIPGDYLLWLKGNVDMSIDLKYTVEHWIAHLRALHSKTNVDPTLQ